ncbi:MAG: ParB/RepB/Spo0J family partition protein [Anaerovoracaceae bacterium]
MIQKKNVEISMDLICVNPNQPRKIFKEEELNELKNSIAEFGVLQPVIVKKDKYGLYLLIAGERRLRAARLAGLTKIPAMIKETDDKDSALISLIENVQRENLNYIEEAYAYKQLIDDYGLTQGEVARKVGKQQSTISNKIRILALPKDIQEQLAENKLTERHARALLKLVEESSRKKVLQRVIDNNLNVKQTEKIIEEVLKKEEEETRKKNKINYISYKIYINTLRKAFSQIAEMEKNAKFTQDDKGDYMEVKIIIPKNNGCFT